MKLNVQNMTSPNGNTVPNQFIVWTDNARYFQSYSTVIVRIDNDGKVVLDCKAWNYSKTTARYRNAFLNESTTETQKKIKDGTYTLDNLN
jgi:hypothetical protein